MADTKTISLENLIKFKEKTDEIYQKKIQTETLPEASIDNKGKIVQYIGETNEDYINGHFYKCTYDKSQCETYLCYKMGSTNYYVKSDEVGLYDNVYDSSLKKQTGWYIKSVTDTEMVFGDAQSLGGNNWTCTRNETNDQVIDPDVYGWFEIKFGSSYSVATEEEIKSLFN